MSDTTASKGGMRVPVFDPESSRDHRVHVRVMEGDEIEWASAPRLPLEVASVVGLVWARGRLRVQRPDGSTVEVPPFASVISRVRRGGVTVGLPEDFVGRVEFLDGEGRAVVYPMVGLVRDRPVRAYLRGCGDLNVGDEVRVTFHEGGAVRGAPTHWGWWEVAEVV